MHVIFAIVAIWKNSRKFHAHENFMQRKFHARENFVQLIPHLLRYARPESLPADLSMTCVVCVADIYRPLPAIKNKLLEPLYLLHVPQVPFI